MSLAPKPFSWSWSKLKNYRTCPKRHWHVDLQKDFKEAESEALTWGNQLHAAMAERIDKKKPLPTIMKRFDRWPANVSDLDDVTTKVENKLAMTRNFEPCGFFDNDAWFRAVIDVLVLVSKRAALTIDWKTGKINPEYEQLGLSAQVIFAHYPEIEYVDTIYVWFGHDTQTVQRYHRSEMLGMWNKLWPTVRQMDDAWRTTTYPPKPSGLCVSYCPVTSCPHHGKGTR